MNEPIKETIELNLDSSGIPKNSMAALIQQLEQVEAKWKSVEVTINQHNQTLARAPRSVAEIQAQLQKSQSTIAKQSGGGKGYNVSAIAQVLGQDAAAFEKYLSGIKKGVEGYHKTIQQFRNLPSAARAAADYESRNYFAAEKKTLKMRDLLRPTVGSVHGTGHIKVEGVIPLSIPAAQVQASVIGPIHLSIPGDQITLSGTGVGVTRNEQGQITGGGAGRKRRKKDENASFSDADMEVLQKNKSGAASWILRRNLVTGEDSATITNLKKAGETISTTFKKIEGQLHEAGTTERGTGDLSPIQKFRVARRILTTGFQADVANLNPSDTGTGLGKLYAKQASALQSLMTPELAAQLNPAQAKAIQAELQESAKKLQAQSARAHGRAATVQSDEDIQLALRAEAMSDLARQGGSSGSAALISGQAQLAMSDVKTNAEIEKARVKAARAAGKSKAPNYRGYGVANIAARLPQPFKAAPMPAFMLQPGFIPKEEEKPSKFQKALSEGFTPSGFATHIVKVAGWAAAVTTLYKSWELVHYSMSRVLDIGEQMAHLQVVFKQQGGSVRELTDDTLALSAAQGRSTEEGMKSATEWSRIVHTRAQVDEAVNVSMIAANVAQMHTGETTKQLSSMMHIYHLQVSDLNSELGKLVYTSQHYNVTLEDLFQGLDRAAPQARQMGMGLSELQGIIAGTVGKTGQSGVVVGNTVKYILQQFNRIPIQTMLRGYGIETNDVAGQLKPGSQILRELFVRYQSLNPTERQTMTTQLAGRFHGTRFVGMMDSYLESQKLAIDSQLNLNAAQLANAAILDTLQNKMAGLKAQWDRFVFSQATTPSGVLGGFTPMQLMTGVANGASGVMQTMNDEGQSMVTPAAAGLASGAGYWLARRAMLSSMGYMTKQGLVEGVPNAAASLMMRAMPTFAREIGAGGVGSILTEAVGSSAAGVIGGPIGMIAAALLPLMPKLGTFFGSMASGPTGQKTTLPGDSWGDVARIYAGRGGASAQKAQLFRTTLDLLSVQNPDEIAKKNIQSAVNLSGTEMPKADAASLASAYKSGDMSTVKEILGRRIGEEQHESVNDLQKEALAGHNEMSAKQKALDEVTAKLNEPYQETKTKEPIGPTIDGRQFYKTVTTHTGLREGSSDRNKALEEVQNLTGAIEQLNQKASQSQELIEDALGTPPEELARKQQYISLLRQEQEMLSELGQMAGQGGSGTPEDRYSAQVQGAQMQVDLAQATYNRLQEFTKGNVEGIPARDAALQQLQESQAQLDSVSSPQMRQLARMQEDREITFRRTDIETQGVGYTESEKLLNQRNQLRGDLGRAEHTSASRMSPNDNAKAYREAVDLKTTEMKLAERIVELRKQEKQIMIDSQREFNKSILFAGPGEMLKRLFVSHASKRGVNTGEFMSWDPEMRKMFYELHGGEAGAKNREEQALLGADKSVPRTLAGAQNQAHRDQAQVDFWRHRMNGDTARAMSHLPAMDLPDLTRAKVAAAQVSALGTAANATANALRNLTKAVGDFGDKIMGRKPATAPSIGLSPGFSLGAGKGTFADPF